MLILQGRISGISMVVIWFSPLGALCEVQELKLSLFFDCFYVHSVEHHIAYDKWRLSWPSFMGFFCPWVI